MKKRQYQEKNKQENVEKVVIDEIRIFLKMIKTDDKIMCKKINVFNEDHKKFFNVIKNLSFNCCRLTDLFSFHSAEIETERTDETERRKSAFVVLNRFSVLQMLY